MVVQETWKRCSFSSVQEFLPSRSSPQATRTSSLCTKRNYCLYLQKALAICEKLCWGSSCWILGRRTSVMKEHEQWVQVIWLFCGLEIDNATEHQFAFGFSSDDFFNVEQALGLGRRDKEKCKVVSLQSSKRDMNTNENSNFSTDNTRALRNWYFSEDICRTTTAEFQAGIGWKLIHMCAVNGTFQILRHFFRCCQFYVWTSHSHFTQRINTTLQYWCERPTSRRTNCTSSCSFEWIQQYFASVLPSWKTFAEIVSLLIDKGANPNLRNNKNKTPLEVASGVEIVQLLQRCKTPYFFFC